MTPGSAQPTAEPSARGNVLARALVVWLLIIAGETVHGILRTIFLTPLLGDFPARQLSVVTGSLLIFGVTWLLIGWVRASRLGQLLGVGLLWVVLTIAFEGILGRWVMGLPWSRLLEDYDLSRGGLMGFGLMFLAAAPTLAARLRKVA